MILYFDYKFRCVSGVNRSTIYICANVHSTVENVRIQLFTLLVSGRVFCIFLSSHCCVFYVKKKRYKINNKRKKLIPLKKQRETVNLSEQLRRKKDFYIVLFNLKHLQVRTSI